MAANWHLVGVSKRLVNQICTVGTPVLLTLRRPVHESMYDKNIDDQVQAAFVPDEVTKPESDKYWTPHPKTGVFGPASVEKSDSGANTSPPSQESVLEQKTFFRPIEDLDKPLPEN